MPADAGSDMAAAAAAAAAAAVPDTKPLTPRSILRRDGCASSGAVEGAPRKRVTFEGSVADDKPSSGGKKLRRRAGGGAAARAAARRTGGNSRLGSLLLPSYAASAASSSGSGYSPPSTVVVASRATTSYDVRAPGRVRQAGCYPWPNAPHSSSSTVESPGGGRRALSSAVAAGPTKSRGRRMFQVQEEMNRAERKATAAAAAAAAAAAVAASASPSGYPASSAVTAAAKCSPEQQRRLERQQQQRRQQEGVRPRYSTGGGPPVVAAAAAAAAAAVEASAPPPESRLTPPVSSSAAAVVSASTKSQTHLAPPSSQQRQQQQQQQQQQQLRGGRGEDAPPSRPVAMTTAAATVVVEIDEQRPRPRPGPPAERPLSPPPERDATGSTDSTGSSRASPHTDDCADGGGDWAGTGREADGRPELRYREYAAGVSITSPPARTAPAKEQDEAAGVVGPAAALEVSPNEASPLAPSGATPAAGGKGSKEDEPPAAAAIQRACDSTAAAAASPPRVEAGGTADNTCKNAEGGSDNFAAGSPLAAAVAVPSGSDSIDPSGSQERPRRVAPESKSTWTSPKCLAEIGDVALGTTPCRSQNVPPVVTPPSDDPLGRTSASQDAASDGSDRDDTISDNDRASASRASGGVDAADGGRMGDGGSNKRGGGANTVGTRGRHKRARIDKQQGNHAGSGECSEITGGVAAPAGAMCSSPPANRQRHPVLVDASPPSTASTASPSPCGGTTAEPCLGHDEDGGGRRPHGDGSSLSPSSPPLLPTLPPQRQEQEPEIEFPASRVLPPAAAAAAIPKVPPADKADAAPPGAEPMEIVAEEEEGKGEPICASSGEVEEHHGAAFLPSPVRAAEVVAVAQRSANGKHSEAGMVASGRGRLPAWFVGSSGASAAAAVAGGGGDDTKGRHKRLKRPSRKILEVREGNGEEDESVVKQRPPASASCAPAAVAAAAANAASVPSRAARTRESSRGGENPTAATAAATAAAAAADVVSPVEVGPKKKRRKRSKSARGLPTTATPLTAGDAVDSSSPTDKAGRPGDKGGARRRKQDGGGGGASRNGGKSQGSTTAAKHRMREAHAHLLRKGAVVPRPAPEPSAAPLAKLGRRMVPSPARTRSSSVAAPPAATGKVATARVNTAEVRSEREESSGRAGMANGDVPAPAPVAVSSWTGWMAPRSPRQPLLLPSQQPAVSVGRGGSRDAEHEAAGVAAPAAGGVCGWMGLLSSGWKGLLSKAAGRSGS